MNEKLGRRGQSCCSLEENKMKSITSKLSLLISALTLLLYPGLNVAAQNGPLQPGSVQAPFRFDVSPPLREIVKRPNQVQAGDWKEQEEGEGSHDVAKKIAR